MSEADEDEDLENEELGNNRTTTQSESTSPATSTKLLSRSQGSSTEKLTTVAATHEPASQPKRFVSIFRGNYLEFDIESFFIS